MVRWAMGVSLLEHRRNEEILEEARVEPIATVMRRRRLEWFGHVKRRGETENIRAVAEMKMEGTRPRGRPKLRWNDTIRTDLKAWSIKEEWATDRERWKGLCKTRYPEQGDGSKRGESKLIYVKRFPERKTVHRTTKTTRRRYNWRCHDKMQTEATWTKG